MFTEPGDQEKRANIVGGTTLRKQPSGRAVRYGNRHDGVTSDHLAEDVQKRGSLKS
jgi:hypothetical protein